MILAFCVGTLFLQQPAGLPPDASPADVQAALRVAGNFLGVAFFSLLYFSSDGYADAAVFVFSLPVWWKQRGAAMHGATAFVLPTLLLRLPWRLAETWVWTLMVGWSVSRWEVGWLDGCGLGQAGGG